MSLTIAKISETDANNLFTKTSLLAGDRIKAVNGKEVQNHWQLEQIVQDIFLSSVTLLAERADPVSGQLELIESQVELGLTHIDSYDVESESDLHHICSMVPRLRINLVDDGLDLQSGDIILAAGDIENPTYKELRDITEEYEKKELLLKIMRTDANGLENTLEVTVVPKHPPDSERVMIGIGVELDAAHPVVAKTISTGHGHEVLDIPCGSVITAVDGVEVFNFYDIIREIKKNTGERITIDYRLNEEVAGAELLDLRGEKDFITVKSTLTTDIPFDFLERLYKADDPGYALVMACKKSVWFIVQTYVTLKGLLARNVSLNAMAGPVGIATMSYKAVEHSILSFMYLLAFISSNLAVINFLPIP
jgi:RIP metalloprotease RseP